MVGLVISGGRVVDPASGMDAAGDVALLDGKIAAVGTGLGGAERIVDFFLPLCGALRHRLEEPRSELAPTLRWSRLTDVRPTEPR